MRTIAGLIDSVLGAPDDESVAQKVRGEVRDLTGGFPLYTSSYHRADLE
jgi:glycine hydroxymethyltransferase